MYLVKLNSLRNKYSAKDKTSEFMILFKPIHRDFELLLLTEHLKFRV